MKVLGGNSDMVWAAKMALDQHYTNNPKSRPKMKAVASIGASNSSDSKDAVCQTDRASITYWQRVQFNSQLKEHQRVHSDREKSTRFNTQTMRSTCSSNLVKASPTRYA